MHACFRQGLSHARPDRAGPLGETRNSDGSLSCAASRMTRGCAREAARRRRDHRAAATGQPAGAAPDRLDQGRPGGHDVVDHERRPLAGGGRAAAIAPARFAARSSTLEPGRIPGRPPQPQRIGRDREAQLDGHAPGEPQARARRRAPGPPPASTAPAPARPARRAGASAPPRSTAASSRGQHRRRRRGGRAPCRRGPRRAARPRRAPAATASAAPAGPSTDRPRTARPAQAVGAQRRPGRRAADAAARQRPDRPARPQQRRAHSPQPGRQPAARVRDGRADLWTDARPVDGDYST